MAAQTAGINTISTVGYRQLPCPVCSHWLKIRIYPHAMDRQYKCHSCHSPVSIEVIEQEENITINTSVTTAVKTNLKYALKKAK